MSPFRSRRPGLVLKALTHFLMRCSLRKHLPGADANRIDLMAWVQPANHRDFQTLCSEPGAVLSRGSAKIPDAGESLIGNREMTALGRAWIDGQQVPKQPINPVGDQWNVRRWIQSSRRKCGGLLEAPTELCSATLIQSPIADAIPRRVGRNSGCAKSSIIGRIRNMLVLRAGKVIEFASPFPPEDRVLHCYNSCTRGDASEHVLAAGDHP